MGFSLDDYVDVAERINLFYAEHPAGSLTTEKMELVSTDAGQFLFVHAKAWRGPEDEIPGDGYAWEPLPGKTPYTKDSELMNAQTAAWGRAIVATGILASKSIASKQEVQARQGAPEKPAQGLPERYVDCLRLAIHSKDKSEAWPDGDEWASVVGSATTKEAKAALVGQLEALATDLGLKPELIRERWEQSRQVAA